MERSEFTALCKGVETGSARFVENRLLHTVGKVIACEGNRFEVEVENRHEQWPSENCREKWEISS